VVLSERITSYLIWLFAFAAIIATFQFFYSGVNYSPIYLTIGFCVFIAGPAVALLLQRIGSRRLIGISLAVILVSGFYLLAFDISLRATGAPHWYGLLLYLAFSAVMYFASTKGRIYSIFMFDAAAAASFFMFMDAAFNLPFTIASGTPGWAYLFGFGLNHYSAFAISFAFSLLVIFSEVIAVSSFVFLSNKRRR
jgi:hypothetical protein